MTIPASSHAPHNHERLTVRFHDDPGVIGEVAPAWRNLLARSGFDDVFASPEWNSAWWDSFGGQHRLRLGLVTGPGGDLRLVAPFLADGSRPGTWRAIGYFRSDYTTLVHASGDLPAVEALIREMRGRDDWEHLVLRHVPADAALLAALPGAIEAGTRIAGRARALADHRRVLVVRTWHREHPIVDRAGLTASENIFDSDSHARQRRWLARHGKVTFRSVADPDEIAARLDQFVALHVAGSNAQSRQSKYEQHNERRFTEHHVATLGALGQARLHLLDVGHETVAAHLGFERAGRVSYYRPCFDPAWAKGSPGKVLLGHIVADAAARGLDEVDLLKGREAYKDRYATTSRITAGLAIHRSRLRHALGAARRRVRG